VTAIQRQIENWRSNPLFGQLIRFGISGGISTLIYAAVYSPLTLFVFRKEHAVWAVPFAFAVAVTAGYFLHSRWSFKGHGGRTPGGKQKVQFVGVQATGMALNALITWVGTAVLHLNPLIPLLPAVALATIVTFILNRWLVFS